MFRNNAQGQTYVKGMRRVASISGYSIFGKWLRKVFQIISFRENSDKCKVFSIFYIYRIDFYALNINSLMEWSYRANDI